jgi:hypothetical protein
LWMIRQWLHWVVFHVPLKMPLPQKLIDKIKQIFNRLMTQRHPDMLQKRFLLQVAGNFLDHPSKVKFLLQNRRQSTIDQLIKVISILLRLQIRSLKWTLLSFIYSKYKSPKSLIYWLREKDKKLEKLKFTRQTS